MDERTQILISLGVSTAVNCVDCFEHFSAKAIETGLTEKDMKESMELAVKVKTGADLKARNGIAALIGVAQSQDADCGCGCGPEC